MTRVIPPLTALLCLLATPVSAQEGGIEVFAAGTLFATGTRTSLSYIDKRKGTLFAGDDEVPDPLGQTLRESRTVLSIDHGLRPDLTVSALLPWVRRELDSTGGDLDGSGHGDLVLLAKKRLYKRDWPRGTFNVSAIGGLELPTGETGERDGGIRLPPALQPGQGAWNPIVGLSSNVGDDLWRYDLHALFKVNTEGAQDFERGDFFSVEGDVAYRFLQTKYPGPTASVKLGLQWRHEGRAEASGLAVANSGSSELRLRPGLSWHPKPNLDVSLSFDIPLDQDFNGTQLGLDTRAFLAVGIRF